MLSTNASIHDLFLSRTQIALKVETSRERAKSGRHLAAVLQFNVVKALREQHR